MASLLAMKTSKTQSKRQQIFESNSILDDALDDELRWLLEMMEIVSSPYPPFRDWDASG